ncbi:MAG: hypothetical protein JXX28_11750 [Deltaproteobacteria bacterium]|nr:hypothetical protein [Deltaproteobacteria bacterium]
MIPLLLTLAGPAEPCTIGFELPDLTHGPLSPSLVPWQMVGVEQLIRAQAGPVRALAIRTAEAEAADLRQAGLSELAVARWLAARAEGLVPDVAGVPAEFSLYAEGAAALHAEDPAAARRHLLALLSLPDAQRRQRTVWALTGLVHTLPLEDHAGRAAAWQAVIDAAATGWPDSAGLAAPAYLHRARELGGPDDPAVWLPACVRYRAAGGEVRCPRDWLTERVRELPRQPAEVLARLAADPLGQQLGSLAFAAQEAPMAPWEAALSGVTVLPEAAVLLAEAAWQRGELDASARWLDAAGDHPLVPWLRARRATRAGDLEGALTLLEEAAPLGPRWQTVWWASAVDVVEPHPERERGRLLVILGRYPEAARAYLAAGDWPDLALVAERLLTVDEAVALGRELAPEAEAVPVTAPLSWEDYGQLVPSAAVSPARLRADLRALIARRLAREGRWEEAATWLDELEARALALAITRALVISADPSAPQPDRAASLLEVARHQREHGWQLLATELAPDWGVEGGSFAPDDRLDALPRAARDLALTQGPALDRRYHFVWTAHDTALSAADLYPVGSPGWAGARCEAGAWLRTKDPALAEADLHAIYWEDPNTEAAEWVRTHPWFPPLEDGRCRLPYGTSTSR